MEIVGRWVGATPPAVGEVVTYLDEGRGYPLVFGPTGRNALGALFSNNFYGVAWTADFANPAVNNGSLTGRYWGAADWVHIEIHMQAGSVTDFGNGTMKFSLPAAGANDGGPHLLTGHLYDFSTGRFFPLRGMIPSGQAVVYPMYDYILDPSVGAVIGSNYMNGASPIALADADAIFLTGFYRIQ
jgi:hypothetical protein